MGLMTEEQKTQFRDEGYLVASGLIPEDVARKGEDAMWAVLEMDREDPETWSRVPGHAINKLNRGLVQHRGLGEPDILACYTDDLLTALSELTGVDLSEIKAPKGILTTLLSISYFSFPYKSYKIFRHASTVSSSSAFTINKNPF